MTRKRSKNSNNRDRRFLKDVMTFRCSEGHSWTSVHGWVNGTPPKLKCDKCKSNTRVIEHSIKALFLGTCNTCSTDWHVSMDDEPSLLIPCCGQIIDYQARGANYYYHQCTNSKCGQEWSDATAEIVYTQRCRRCFNAGEILGARRMNQKDIERLRNKKKAYGRDSTGSHNAAYCDMCQKLNTSGVSSSCTKYKEVGIGTQRSRIQDQAGRIRVQNVDIVNYAR